MYKTVAEVTAALNEAPNQAIVYENYDGKKYISWDDSVRELNRIFGPFGWSTRAISQSGHPAQGVYLAAIEVSVTVLDDETGNPITVTRAGFGRSIAQATKYERDNGVNVATDLMTHDTAASAAGSDALSKAVKLLGAAFGLDFYGEAKRARTQGTRPATVNATRPASNGRGPSEKQMTVFANNGYTAEMVAQLPDWRATLDGIFAQPKGQKRTLQPVAANADDIPF